jgi:hypothetical protein
VPAIEFPADSSEHADLLEADAAMHADTRIVGHRDTRKRRAIALLDQIVEQAAIQGTADALAMTTRIRYADTSTE